MFEFVYVWVYICLNIFHSNVPFICYPSIQVCSCRVSRKIHQHTFSCLAGAQFTNCMTCPTWQAFLFCFPHTITFFPVFQCLSLSLHMFKLVYFFTCLFLCFHLFTIFPSQCAPHGSAKQSTNTVLVAWSVQSFLITSPASPYKAQQSYLLHSAIYPILPSTLSPSKTPGTSFSLTSSTMLWFRLTLR